MSDIKDVVWKLRHHVELRELWPCGEAADEIERLRAELAAERERNAKLAEDDINRSNAIVRLETELAAERERAEDYRASLSALALYLSVGSGDETTTAKEYHDRIRDGISFLTDKLSEQLAYARERWHELHSGLHGACDRAEKAEARVAKLREALEPFAELADLMKLSANNVGVVEALDDLRRARAVLEETKGDGDE